MARVPGFMEDCERMKKIHAAKNEDYATDENPFSNFDVAEYGMFLFKHGRDKTFACPIFTKLARLATLLNSGKDANHESVGDSMIDIAKDRKSVV